MSTGPTAKTVAIVQARACDMCERCASPEPCQVHHRRPRGMGGTRRPRTNMPSNLLFLCAKCHREVELNRTVSLEQGWLVRHEHDPAERHVWIAGHGWTVLDNDGNYEQGEAA